MEKVANNNIALYVKKMRKEFKMTQEDLALHSGVGLRFIRDLEQGKVTIKLDKVLQVLNLFNAELCVRQVKLNETR